MNTFRVQVAPFANGQRFSGRVVTVQAATREEAAEMAVTLSARHDAEQVAKFNADCERFGTTPRTVWPEWRVERVRKAPTKKGN